MSTTQANWRGRSIRNGLDLTDEQIAVLEAMFVLSWESLHMLIGGKFHGVSNPLSEDSIVRVLQIIAWEAGQRQGNLFSEVR